MKVSGIELGYSKDMLENSEKMEEYIENYGHIGDIIKIIFNNIVRKEDGKYYLDMDYDSKIWELSSGMIKMLCDRVDCSMDTSYVLFYDVLTILDNYYNHNYDGSYDIEEGVYSEVESACTYTRDVLNFLYDSSIYARVDEKIHLREYDTLREIVCSVYMDMLEESIEIMKSYLEDNDSIEAIVECIEEFVCKESENMKGNEFSSSYL